MLRTIAYGSALAAAVFGASIEDCGGPDDLMSNVNIGLFPDPPSPDQDFIMTMRGDLRLDVKFGSLTAHMTISAEGKDVRIDSTTQFALNPGITKGAQAIRFGPFKYPKLPDGVKPIIDGNLTIADDLGKQVSCLRFNQFPMMAAAPTKEIVKDDPIENCGAPSDHLKDIRFTVGNGIAKINGTMDEDVTSGELDIDMTVGVNRFADYSINFNVNIPFTYTPGIMKGDLMVQLGPVHTLVNGEATSGISGQGTLRVKDSAGGEIVCVKVDV